MRERSILDDIDLKLLLLIIVVILTILGIGFLINLLRKCYGNIKEVQPDYDNIIMDSARSSAVSNN